ncbi:MAG: hypothetical protein QM698_09185 [Micropepsaceae bacterium]
MSADARNHLLLWLDHHIELSRRQFAKQAAVFGPFRSGSQFKAAMELAEQTVRALTNSAFDRVNSLPEVPDGYGLAVQKLREHVSALFQAPGAAIRKGIGNSASLWRIARDRQTQITKDIETAAELAAFGRSQACAPTLPARRSRSDISSREPIRPAHEGRSEATVASGRHSVHAAPAETQPPLPKATLEEWWKALGASRDLLSVERLWAAAKADHPHHFISRIRIRVIAGPRKRGPKGSAGK